MLDDLKQKITEMILEFLVDSSKTMLNITDEIFQKSISNIQGNIVETPTQFSATLVDTLKIVSETACLPVAGLLLTYIFCYELYEMVVEKNRGGDFETGQLLFLIIKTAMMILLVTNAFDITLAFFDLGQWMINQIPVQNLSLTQTFATLIDENDSSLKIGMGVALLIISLITMLVGFAMAGIIYLVAWSRMITILLYISVAPLPFVTLMNKDWIGGIGQNYLKQIIALMLQGFFMMMCLVIYSGLLEKVGGLITAEGKGVYAILLTLVSMVILVVTLTRTHTLAKNIVGVS